MVNYFTEIIECVYITMSNIKKPVRVITLLYNWLINIIECFSRYTILFSKLYSLTYSFTIFETNDITDNTLHY